MIYASGYISLYTSTSSYSIKHAYIYIKYRVAYMRAFIIFETNEWKGTKSSAMWMQFQVPHMTGVPCVDACMDFVYVWRVCSYVTVTHAGEPAAMIGEASRRGCQGNDHFSLPSMRAVTPSTLSAIRALYYAKSLRCQQNV